MQSLESIKNKRLCIACKSAIHPEATLCPFCKTAQGASRLQSIGDFFKWVGGITAVLSMIITMGQVGKIYQNMQDKEKTVSEFIKIGNLQRDRGNYSAAWDSYAEAITLNPGSRHARDERVQLAMLWMRKTRGTEKKLNFSEIADRLSPVLFRGVTLSKGKKAADYIAHLGWAMYLKSQDGNARRIDVQPYFDWAIKEDPQNAYAHAMLGFWMLFRRQPLTEVKPHFEIALASIAPTDKAEIRDLQISALLNSGGRDIESETLRVTDELYRQGETLSIGNRRQVLNIYERNWRPKDWKMLSTALSPEVHLKMLSILSKGQNRPVGPKLNLHFVEARLLQTQGESQKALEIYQSIQGFFGGKGQSSSLLQKTEAAIVELTNTP